MSEGGEPPRGWSWKIMLPDWMRKGRERVNLTGVPVENFKKRTRKEESKLTQQHPNQAAELPR